MPVAANDGFTYTRIAADDIRPGDQVARTRTAPFETIAAIQTSPVAVRLLGSREPFYTTDHGTFTRSATYTIARPRRTAMWWRREDASTLIAPE